MQGIFQSFIFLLLVWKRKDQCKQNLRCHPSIGPCFSCHDSSLCLNTCNAKVSNLSSLANPKSTSFTVFWSAVNRRLSILPSPQRKKIMISLCSDKCHCLIKTPTLVMMTKNRVKSKNLSYIVFWYYIVCLHVGSQMAVLTYIGLHEYTMCLWA